MIKRFILYLSVLTLMLITAGCVTPVNPVKLLEKTLNRTEVVELPERKITSREDLPGDVELVMAAMINAIRGDKNLSHVSFDREGKHEFLEERFTYKAFDVKFADIIFFKTEKPEGDIRPALLECGLYFEDAIGRSAYVRVRAEYVVTKKDVIITASEYELLPNPYPTVKAYILPRDAVEKAPPELKNNFAGLYLLAQKKAITLEPTQQERIKHEQYDQLSFLDRLKYKSDAIPESYRVMLFCMERLRPESRFVMTVSQFERASENSLSTPYYLNDNGWVVGIVGAKFALDAYGRDLFFHAQFNPGIDPANTELKHIGRFSSIKNYHPEKIKVDQNPYLASWKKQGQDLPTQGPISTGTVFLNPAVVTDAKIIQNRLAEAGFYAMKIDGAFGNGSKRSLAAFKKANGLKQDSVWDIGTQKALFKGSGL